MNPNPLRLLVAAAVLVLVVGLSQLAWATVWGHRIDKQGKRVDWPTIIQADQGVTFEIPNHGRVLVHLEGETLYVTAQGDETGPRSIVVRGIISNQLRCGFER